MNQLYLVITRAIKPNIARIELIAHLLEVVCKILHALATAPVVRKAWVSVEEVSTRGVPIA
jgi:hypothetical protein